MCDHFKNSFISTITIIIIIIIIIIIYNNHFYFNDYTRCDLFLLPVCAFLLWIILECILIMYSVLSP